jgi:hypothetical protein
MAVWVWRHTQGMAGTLMRRRAFQTQAHTRQLAVKFLQDAERMWPKDDAVVKLLETASTALRQGVHTVGMKEPPQILDASQGAN